MANIYISTTGAGDNSGSSLANAINGGVEATFRSTIQGATSGDVFRIVEGTYTFTTDMLTISTPLSMIGYTSGDAESSSPLVVLTGSDPTTYDVSDPDAAGNNKGIIFSVSKDNIILKHLHVKYFRWCVYAEAGKNRDITISDCKFEICEEGIVIKGDAAYVPGSNVAPGAANSQGWAISDVTVQNFAKTGIRIRYGCKDITLTNITMDGGGSTYNPSSGYTPQQTGIDVGNTSGGNHTTDTNINITNFYCTNMNNYSVAGSRQGDGLKTESTTTGSLNGGYIELCAESGCDNKGDWVVSNVVFNRNHQQVKSYAAAPQTIVLNNCLMIAGQTNGGTQETRAISIYGFMTMNNCTVWGHGDASKMVKFIGQYVSNCQLIMNNCIIGYTSSTSPNMTKEVENSSSNPSSASPLISKTNCKWHNDEAVNDSLGTAPQGTPSFTDETDTDSQGGNTNWNSSAYGPGIGYWYSAPADPPGGGTYTITITGVSMSQVNFS